MNFGAEDMPWVEPPDDSAMQDAMHAAMRRTTRDYRCGQCGAAPGSPCLWGEDDPCPGVYHRDRELRFVRSVNRQARRA